MPTRRHAPPDQAPIVRFMPWRFILFLGLCLLALPLTAILPMPIAIMVGFDCAAAIFLISLAPLLGHEESRMRAHARTNDANRVIMLALTVVVTMVLLVVVAAELSQDRVAPAIALILATLALAWTFANMVYALHYAFLYYSGDADGKDRGGIRFPGTGKPDYWDFIYFAFTLGMTFQTSDVEIDSRTVRKTVTFHCLAAFIFNLGIIAFTINVLGAR